MQIYNPRWPRKSFQYQLPILTPNNIKMVIFHFAHIGDLDALKLLCKSPMADLEASDDASRTALIFAAIGGLFRQYMPMPMPMPMPIPGMGGVWLAVSHGI
ncbi:hypothetical protein BASA50_008216 [Batrachochytrium salamandrivorans]|uniref:F-box domain-containing protein n=1 Tax=Batrachochytrium salamandrivorans TaxID=1357716 RepID=A0ABQ8F4R6_9FUNG|nr:hypothetical protein BASA50_008216 [Batrachochytrium salamandrivorans]